MSLRDTRKDLTKDDVLIICGDAALTWDKSRTTEKNVAFHNKNPWTTISAEGNHENFDTLYELPIIYKYGGPMYKVANSVYYAERGNIYNICGKKVFIFGGATSTDKAWRTPHKSWWPQEEPTEEQMELGLQTVRKYAKDIDIVITHTCPSSIMHCFDYNRQDSTTQYLEQVLYLLENSGNTKYHWFFGHMHQNLTFVDQHFTAVYNAIHKIKE